MKNAKKDLPPVLGRAGLFIFTRILSKKIFKHKNHTFQNPDLTYYASNTLQCIY